MTWVQGVQPSPYGLLFPAGVGRRNADATLNAEGLVLSCRGGASLLPWEDYSRDRPPTWRVQAAAQSRSDRGIGICISAASPPLEIVLSTATPWRRVRRFFEDQRDVVPLSAFAQPDEVALLAALIELLVRRKPCRGRLGDPERVSALAAAIRADVPPPRWGGSSLFAPYRAQLESGYRALPRFPTLLGRRIGDEAMPTPEEIVDDVLGAATAGRVTAGRPPTRREVKEDVDGWLRSTRPWPFAALL